MTRNAGNWYSWPAATAGGNHTEREDNEPNSICPDGWQLIPNARIDPKSYYALLVMTYESGNNDDKMRYQPLSFTRSGVYSRDSISARASSGRYWSSTMYYSGYAYYLDFSSSNLAFNGHDYGVVYGNSIRCVSR